MADRQVALPLRVGGFIRPSSMVRDKALIDQAIRSGVSSTAARHSAPPKAVSVEGVWNPMQEAAQLDILWELAKARLPRSPGVRK